MHNLVASPTEPLELPLRSAFDYTVMRAELSCSVF